MILREAERLALEAMDRHGLIEQGWRFEFDTARRRFGACHYGLRKITLSRHLTALNNPLVVYNTILHEVAHALAPRHVNHGPEWRAIAKAIGCTGDRCYGAEVVKPPKAFTGTCPSCGRVIQRHRRNAIACGQCCRRYNHNQFDLKYLFNWERTK